MIRRAEKSDLRRIARLDREMAQEIRFHGDVIADSVLVSESGGKLYGAGYVLKGQGRFLHLVFKTRIQTERGITAAEELLSEWVGRFRMSSGSDRNEERPILRLWCKETDEAYAAFLESFGFRVGDRMLSMERKIQPSEYAIWKEPDSVRPVDLSSRDAMEAYLLSTEEAYGMPDREAEMRYRLTKGHGTVYGYYADDGPVSFTTVWPLKEGVYATENVFTKKAYRRRGYAERLLQETALRLAKSGAETLRLNVYTRDNEAIRLYERLGYRTINGLKEYWLIPEK